MDCTENHGGARAPLSRLSSGHTYYTLESLQGVTALPPLPFSSTSLPSSAFALRQSVPIHMGGRAMPPTLYPVSTIGTHDLRDTMIKGPYRQPITDRKPTLNIMNYGAEPIGYSIGHLQSLNRSVDPTQITQQYQPQEFVNRTSPPPQIYQHQSRQPEIFTLRLGKNSDSGLQPKSNNRAHREIPGIKDMDAKTPKIPGWCSLCDVTCSTKEVLHKQHVLGKKHQSRLKKLKEKGSEDVVKSQKKQPQGLLGWCSLCGVNCGSLQNLHELHMSGKKHLSMLGMAKTKEQETEETGKNNVLGKRKDDSVKEERDMLSKKRHKLHKGDAAHAQVTEDGNSEAHLPVYGETESVAGRKVEEEAFVKAQDEGAD
eukprot:PITA_34422